MMKKAAPAAAPAKPAVSATPAPKFTPPTVISAPGLDQEIEELPF
jgi:hypothetical protein